RWRRRGRTCRFSWCASGLPTRPSSARTTGRETAWYRTSLCGPLVLAIHCADIDDFRLLGFMRMLCAGVDTEIAKLHASQRSTRDHTFNGLLDDALRETTLQDR